MPLKISHRYWQGLILLLALLWIGPGAAAQEAASVQPRLQQELTRTGTASFLVILKAQPQADLFLQRRGLQRATRAQRARRFMAISPILATNSNRVCWPGWRIKASPIDPFILSTPWR